MDFELLKKCYEDMLFVRQFETQVGSLYLQKKIGGFCHLCIGQEACIIGSLAAMTDDDPVITSYRCHGHAIMRTDDPKKVLAELLGYASGCSKGKGGSMHMFCRARNFWGGHGIVGAQIPIGTGIAYQLKYNQKNNVCAIYMGDGATNQGQVYEAWNMASLWRLPALYIIENNEYGMGTSVKRSSAVEELHTKASSCGIHNDIVDGMCVESVYNATKNAINYIKTHSAPVCLEFKTYRHKGHSMSDPATYRSKDEVDNFKKNKDPISRAKESLLRHTDEQSLFAIEQRIKIKIKDIVSQTTTNPIFPSEDEFWTDIQAS